MRINNNKTLILNKIKSHYKFKNDAEFARFLGIKPNSLSNWYKRNTIDYDLIFTKCEDIDIEWLLSSDDLGDQKENAGKKYVEDFPAIIEKKQDEKEWEEKYNDLALKYTNVLEENNQLLKNKLKELLSDDKSA